MHTVKDLNGKEFTFSIDQLQDTNSDLFPTKKVKDTTEPIEVQIFNAKDELLGVVGKDFNIFDSANGQPKALDVYVETTHSGGNLNYGIYDSDSLEEDAGTFLSPYSKPLL